jgi:predicted membrane protein
MTKKALRQKFTGNPHQFAVAVHCWKNDITIETMPGEQTIHVSHFVHSLFKTDCGVE